MNGTTHSRVAAPPVPPEVVARHLDAFLHHPLATLRRQAQAALAARPSSVRPLASRRASHARRAGHSPRCESSSDDGPAGPTDPAPSPLDPHQQLVVADVLELLAQAVVADARRSQ